MPAGELNLYIEQGATFRKTLTWKTGTPAALVNLTGYTARLQVRDKVTSDTALLSLTTENDGIILGGAAGTIALYVSAADTSAIAWKKGVYDLEMIAPNGDVRRLVAGSVEVSQEVTR